MKTITTINTIIDTKHNKPAIHAAATKPAILDNNEQEQDLHIL